jgi:branched-chain amino acid transport system ATP-binding protein
MLEIADLVINYGATRAVRGVSFEVGAADACALLGPNGAGKTSTLRAVSQLVPYSGSIRFDGSDLKGKNPSQVTRLGLIHVPEGRHVFPTLSVHENLQMGTIASSGRTPTYSMSDVYDLFPALTRLRRRGGYALSGGEQQMVAVARALCGAPQVLLLDEPLEGLAPVVIESLFETLLKIRDDTGLSMVLVEQKADLALSFAKDCIVIDRGKIVHRGPSKELQDNHELQHRLLSVAEV